MVLAGGHHQDAAGRGLVVERGAVPGVRLDQQDHRAGVDRPVGVQGTGVDRVERAVVAAAGVVGDEDVEPSAEGFHGVGEEPGRGFGAGEVGGPVGDAGAGRREGLAYGRGDVLGVVGAPGLGGVVRDVVVEVDARTVRGQPAGDGVADAAPPAGTGDERGTRSGSGSRARSAAVGTGSSGMAAMIAAGLPGSGGFPARGRARFRGLQQPQSSAARRGAVSGSGALVRGPSAVS